MSHSPPNWKYNPSVSQSKQFPLYFTNPYVDSIARTLTSFRSNQIERIIYMGPRYTSSSKLIKVFSHAESRSDNEIDDSEIYGEEGIGRYNYDYTEKERYYPVRASEYRLFSGMNPTAKKSQLRFDSNFECGNLDLVVSVGDSEYDLYMRVDSNTKGHTCWFFFKVTDFVDRQRVKFNLVNFSRSGLMYESGMRVFKYCSSMKEWAQDGEKVEYYPSRKARYVQHEKIGAQWYTVSFEHQFKIEDEFVYFAYCVPYSYSFLNFTLAEIEKKYYKIVDVDRQNLSAAGLPIPLLTITNKNSNLINLESQEDEKKEVCLVVGRLHPGETQGSWILHGFINYLCSPKAKELRNRTIFKIIPMVNVDGVVAGNFRAGLLGRDLNRCFHQPQLLNEIGLIRSIAFKFKPFIFLDFHGHSSKKNIFTYGPDYAIDNRYYLSSRLFPKIISKCSKAFRYYACSNRISANKKSTGRSVMLKTHQITYCFTIQTSSFAYGPKKAEVLFDRYEYIEAGSSICMGVDKFMKIIYSLPRKYDLQREIDRTKQKSRGAKRGALTSEGANLNEDDNKLLQEILCEEPSKFDKESGQQDSDFEEDNDYTEKELKCMLADPTQGFFSKRREARKQNTKVLAFLSQQPRKNSSLNSDNSIKMFVGPKLTEPDEPQAQFPKRKVKQHKYLKHLTHDGGKNHTQSMHLNVESFPPPLQPNPNVNKIHISLSSKIFSQDSCIILEDPLTKLQSVNHVSLDYAVSKASSDYQPFSEMKTKQREGLIVRRRKQKQKSQNSNDKMGVKQQSRIQIKHTLLPMLGRNGNMSKSQSRSLIEQILENHERSRSNRVGKHAKIFYY